MSDFKNTTRTVSGHHHWGGGSVGGGTGGTINRLARGGAVDKIDANPGHAEVFPKEGDRMHGNTLTLRKEAPTQELAEHGGKSPLISKFKKGGPTRHFHVHVHRHAQGGKIKTTTKTYRSAEQRAEHSVEGKPGLAGVRLGKAGLGAARYGMGGRTDASHVHDSTHIPAGGPDYRKGGKTKPVRKNAGGAMYAPGGGVSMGGAALSGPPAVGALGRMAMRPQGLPMRPQPPMRRPMALPGPAPLARAGGGTVPMRKVAKQEVAKHVRTAPPRGHGVK